MSKLYRKSVEDVVKVVGVNDKGLKDDEVKIRREKYGFNELEEAAYEGAIKVFFNQFKDFLVLILLGAAIISAFLGKFESTLVIMVVVTINAIPRTVQHIKAEQSLNSLKALASPTAKVMRNGHKMEGHQENSL